jgi:hypothetical protein
MDERIAEIFRFELRLQCEALLHAAAALAAAEPRMPRPTDDHWIALQELLVAGANISKLLWGSGGKKADNRSDLRDSLGVTDASPLRDPVLRNDFEHIDERIETYFSEGPERIYMGRNVGGGIDTTQVPVFGHYFPETGDVAFFTHVVNVPAVVAETENLRTRLDELLDPFASIRGRAGGDALRVLSDPPTAEELRSIGLDPDYEIRPPGAPPRFPRS